MDEVRPPTTSRSQREPRPKPPHPRTATDLTSFVALLEELRHWAGHPGKPVGFKKLEEMAKDRIGIGALSGSTMHRVLSGQQDLAFMREPERFVADLVKTLGADPDPWVVVLKDLLGAAASSNASVSAEATVTIIAPELGEPSARPVYRGWRRFAVSRKVQVVTALALVAASFVVWAVAHEGTLPLAGVDYSRPATIESGTTGLRLAVDQNSDQPGGSVIVQDGTRSDVGVWDIVAPYRNNPWYWQLRPIGKLLMCLHVQEASLEEGATVEQWGCNGGQHQYWRLYPTAYSMLRIINLGSGKCLTVAGVEPQAGMRLVQRTCNDHQPSQQWRTFPVSAPATTSSSATQIPTAVGPDPAEYPGGGKDQSCDGLSPVLDPSTTPWEGGTSGVRDERPAEGQVGLGPGAAGSVHMMRANRRNSDGVLETFYWAEGYVLFTPSQFTMSLQWTALPGPGGWHTCSVTFTKEHGRPATIALPRDHNRDGTKDIQFRVCLAYQPDGATNRYINCAGRY